MLREQKRTDSLAPGEIDARAGRMSWYLHGRVLVAVEGVCVIAVAIKRLR